MDTYSSITTDRNLQLVINDIEEMGVNGTSLNGNVAKC